MRHGVKISLSLLLTLCIMALCFTAFGAIVPVTDVEQLAVLYDIYLSTVGISPIFFIDGVASSESNAISLIENSALITDLWDAWQSTMPASLQMSISDFINATTINYEVSPNGYNTVILDVTAVENFDKLTNWLLGTKLGVSSTKESDSLHYHTTGNFGNSLVTALSNSSFPVLPTSAANKNSVLQNGMVVGYNASNQPYYFAASPDGGSLYYVFYLNNNLAAVSDDANGSLYLAYGFSFLNDNVSESYSGKYFYSIGQNIAYKVDGIPTFTSYDDALHALGSAGTNTSLLVKPNKPEIYIPDTEDVNYLPKEKVATLTSKIGSPGSVVDPSSILNDLLDKASTNKPVVQNPFTEDPDPVINPLVPFDLPSFEFNFSGIWYYVVQWINSLRSGFSFIASTWAALPFAMVIPIYASAVVVIVIGTFKRFFS